MQVHTGGFVAAAPTLTADSAALRRRATLRPRTRTLVVQHGGNGVTGKLVRSVSRLHSEAVIVQAEAGEPLPNPTSYRMAALVGSARFADALASGQLASEVQWIRQADAAATAVLGVGHGARALAYAFGGEIAPAPEPHRGWILVQTAVPHRIAAGPWLAWQHDVINLPDPAELLAENRLGPQAFRIGRHLGVQFHPEATPSTVRRWARATARRDGGWPLIDALNPDETAADVRGRRVFESFASSV